MKNCLQLFFGIAFVVISCHANKTFDYFKEKPPFLPSCEIYKPNFAQCNRYVVDKFINALKIGIPELINETGSMEPIYLERTDYSTENSLAKLDGNLTDLYIRGFSNLTVKRSDVSKNDFTWVTEMYMPLLRFEYNFNIEGQVQGVPVKSNSDAIVDWEHVDITMTVSAHLFKKDDLTFYGVDAVYLNLKPRHVRSNIVDILDPQKYESPKLKVATFDVDPAEFDNLIRPRFTKILEGLFLNLLKVACNAIPLKYFISDLPTSA